MDVYDKILHSDIKTRDLRAFSRIFKLILLGADI
jgi:hypothetical protein